MRKLGSFSQNLRRFAKDRGGNFLVITGVAVSLLTLAAGYGVNTAQLVLTRSNLVNALDSAVTSTARDLTTGVIAEQRAREVVEAFLSANGAAGFASADRLRLDSLVIDRQAKTVSAQASVDVALAFPLFGSEPTRRVSAESAARYNDRKIEVAMMLDITGSMAGQRLRDLKAAATRAVDTFLGGQNAANPRVRVAIVPYADAVNTGLLSHTVYRETSYTEAPPPPLGAPQVASTGDRCATERKGPLRYRDAGPDQAMVNRDSRLSFCPATALQPLTSDASRLRTAISSFSAGGHTAGHIGIQWSWYLLSPSWASVLPASSRPSAYGDRDTVKYAILMTDGEFNTAFLDTPQTQNVRNQPMNSRNHAENLCAEMKRQGITVFTIGFMLEQAAAKRVLENCASPRAGNVRTYFDTSTAAELDRAFQEIASNVERLALTR